MVFEVISQIQKWLARGNIYVYKFTQICIYLYVCIYYIYLFIYIDVQIYACVCDIADGI